MSRLMRVVFTVTLALGCGSTPAASEPRAVPSDHASGHPGAHHGHGHGHARHDHDFSDVQRFAALFDAPDRDQWQKPDEVVRLLALAPGMTVVDLGAGTGYFLPHLVPAVGSTGQVLALDVEPAMVEHMRARIAESGLENAEARQCAAADPALPAQSVDRILVVNTWHHIEDRRSYGRLLREALRPGGFVLVVDFTAEAGHGPPPEMRLPPETVVQELSAAGFSAAILDETLPDSYVVRGST